MRQIRSLVFFTVPVLCLACAASGQDPLTGILKMGSGDVAETKRQAEIGDSAAQLSLANTLLGNMRPADALLGTVRRQLKAASRPFITGATFCFTVLLAFPARESVKADPVIGIQLIYCAATNGYTAAYYDMHRGYRDGIGLVKDMVQAYAWLQLDVDSSPGSSVRRVETEQACARRGRCHVTGRQIAGSFVQSWPLAHSAAWSFGSSCCSRACRIARCRFA
jgi:TPR repeat protein